MDENEIRDSLRNISFGALVNSQSTLDRNTGAAKTRTDDSHTDDNDEPPFKAQKRDRAGPEAKHRKVKRESSKHAPLEMSAKKPVSRHRDVIDLPSNKSRDPRFDPLITGGAPVDMTRTRQNYAFLDDYQEDEMKMMRAELKKGNTNDSRRAEIEKKLQSMESRKLSQKKKDEEREWLTKYKKKEREAVKDGKTPFYLKKCSLNFSIIPLFKSFQGFSNERVFYFNSGGKTHDAHGQICQSWRETTRQSAGEEEAKESLERKETPTIKKANMRPFTILYFRTMACIFI